VAADARVRHTHPMATPTEISPIGKALGRLPTGLYIVTTEEGGAPLGFVGSFVMQMGIAPPVVAVAVGKDRAHLAAIRASKLFGVSILEKGSNDLMGRFFRKYEPGTGPFDTLALERGAQGTPVLSEALAWIECRLQGEYASGDHVVVFGEVIDGRQSRDGEPAVHLRKNGLGY
jgi:3-hydroxy-9,10-secoandrosta-1,3,5(10)-triene-9,17-dione monooxygenase reductase component